MSWFIYLIQSTIDDSIYTGITTDVDKRLATHNNGKGAAYTKSRRPFVLRRTFTVENRSEASKLEYKIKQLSRKNKLLLISDGDLSILGSK